MKMSTILMSLALIVAACNPIEDKVSLAAPSDIKVEQTGLETVRLTWSNTSISYDGVILERANQTEGSEFAEIARPGNGVLIYNDKNHNGDAVYQYRLTTFQGSLTSEPAVVTFRYSKLPAPTDFAAELTDAGLVLTWKDNCTGEEGYIVRKSANGGSFADWEVLAPNTETVTDADIVSGRYEYQVMAYAGEERSAAASVEVDNTGVPQVKTDKVTPSWHQVHIQFYLQDDGGFPCEAGICWREDGNRGATVNENCYTFPARLRTGDPYYGSAQGLVPGKTYYFRPWVKYDGKYHYYPEVSSALLAEPEAFVADWTDISAQYAMPSSIRLYKTTTEVTGRKINAWYAVADMSRGNLELRTFMTSSATKPSVAAKSLDGVQIIVNGGYFGGGQSYSYVMDQGNEAAAGVRAVTRSYYADADRNTTSKSFNITRGAFGVNRNQEPSLKWLYGSCQWAYDTPLPAFNSGPVLKPTDAFPSVRHTWDVYSAIGGGPVILHDGHICIDYLTTKDKGNGGRYVGNPELLDDDIFGPSVRPPRTAVGHTEDGKIVIMVVDGRDSGGSKGVSLDELARLMKGVGCVNVLNLDGGGSTVMCATPDATVLNNPSDGSERAVMSFVAVVAK